MKKIAMIRSSPHQNGNTNLLADAFIAGAKQTRNEIIDVNLSKENIKYCQGVMELRVQDHVLRPVYAGRQIL